MAQRHILILIIGTAALIAFLFSFLHTTDTPEYTAAAPEPAPPAAQPPVQQTNEAYTADGIPYTIIADNLTVPWDIAFAPTGTSMSPNATAPSAK